MINIDYFVCADINYDIVQLSTVELLYGCADAY